MLRYCGQCIVIMLGLLGCNANKVEDSGERGEVEGENESSDVSSETSSMDDGLGDLADTALVGFLGLAEVVNGQYVGEEDWYFVAQEGNGDDVCRIRYLLRSTQSRTEDCVDCDWAYDLEISDATIVSDNDIGCEAALGFDDLSIDSLNGMVVSYGYQAAYVGHEEVLMVENDDDLWSAVCFASFDEETHVFSYDREDGFVGYERIEPQ